MGGTSYWIQHLLFPNRLAKDINSETNPSPILNRPEISEDLAKLIRSLPPDLLDLFNSLPNSAPSADVDPEGALQLYDILKVLDGSVAARWHWKDTRKVLRSLHIIRETGRKPSELISEQSKDVLKPRFVVIFFYCWIPASVYYHEKISNTLLLGLLRT